MMQRECEMTVPTSSGRVFPCVRRSPPPRPSFAATRPPLTLIPFLVPQINVQRMNTSRDFAASLTNSPNYQFWTGHYITSWDAARFNSACSSKAGGEMPGNGYFHIPDVNLVRSPSSKTSADATPRELLESHENNCISMDTTNGAWRLSDCLSGRGGSWGAQTLCMCEVDPVAYAANSGYDRTLSTRTTTECSG